ncbi:MAG: heparinase II/III domain-containing protein [Armatimonadota bacterium]
MRRLTLVAAMPLIVGGIMLTAPDHVQAEPCTLYKPHNVASARENIQRHDWARSILESYRNRVAYAMQQDRAWFEQMTPELTPWPSYGQVCPECVGEQCSMGETGVLQWSIEEPEQLVCRYCGAVYPDPDFPETGSITAQRMSQTFTFYVPPEEAAHPDDTEGEHAYRWASWPVHVSFSGLIRCHKAKWVAAQALPLAKAYTLTGEVQYAERCAWVLDVLARRYPGWLYHSYYGTYADMPPGEAAAYMGEHDPMGVLPAGAAVTAFPDNPRCTRLQNFWGSGRLTTGVGGEGSFLLDCTVAYDLIRDARRDDGTPVLTDEMDERIVSDLILAGCADLENYDNINNKCGPGRALSAACGILFGQPERVRRGLEGLEKLLAGSFHFDGFCRESPSYSSMHLGLMRDIPDILQGYSDPPGYQPDEGERLEDLQPYEDLDRYRLALLSMVRMLRPDLSYPVLGDTHAGSGISSIWVEILADHYGERYAGLLETVQGAPLSDKGGDYALWHRPPDLQAPAGESSLPLRTEWFPGWHVAVLRNGHPHGRNALYLNGYEMHGHRHYDTLGITYFALGREMASDRGYIWDDPRNAWTKSTYSHNLVTVDGQNQLSQGRHSALELFAAAPGIEVVQASANAYEQCSQYRRTCALVQLPGDRSYAVDIFRVTGGDLHQWCLNSNGDQFELHGLELTPRDGKISWMENLRVARPAGTWRATWHNEGVKLDAWMPTPIDRLIIADAPGWRTYKGYDLNAAPITEILAERAGEALDSTFTAVLAPWEGEGSPIASVREVTPTGDESGAVAVVVERAGGTDWIISALDDQPRSYGPVEMAGRFGFVSLDADGRVRAMYLLEGTRLSVGEEAIELPQARIERQVASVDGRTVTLAEPLPAEVDLAGAYVTGGITGWEIESAEGRTITVRDYPAQPCDRVIVPMSAWRQAG